MPNIEIKARINNIENLEALAQAKATQFLGIDHQIDTYYKTQEGRLKLRESSLSKTTKLIPYLRPDTIGPKVSLYTFLTSEQPDLAKELLGKILGTEVVVDKHRSIYLIDNVRVHLDKVKDLGEFFELEAVYDVDTEEERRKEIQKVDELLAYFGITKVSLISGSYRELLLKKQ